LRGEERRGGPPDGEAASSPMLRLFVAIELPEEVRAAMRRRLAKLRAQLPQSRWVDPDQAHLTLAFLGHHDEKRREPLPTRAFIQRNSRVAVAGQIDEMQIVVDPVKINQLGASGTGACERQARLFYQTIQQTRFAHVASPQEGNLTWAAVSRKLGGAGGADNQTRRYCFGFHHGFFFTFQIAWLRAPDRREP